MVNSLSSRAPTVDKLAIALGVDRTTVYRWKNHWGLDDLYDEASGGWDPEEVEAWARDMKRARRAVLRPGFDVSPELEDGRPEDAGKDWGEIFRKAKAILATLQAKRMQETLMDRDEVEAKWVARVGEVTSTLEALPAQLAPQITPLEREQEVQAVLEEAFREVRKHFARDQDA